MPERCAAVIFPSFARMRLDDEVAPQAVIPSTELELEDSTHTGRSLRPAPPPIRF